MTKKLFSILRYTSIVALVASLFIMSGCGDDEEPAPTQTISELISSDAYKQASGVDKSLALDSSAKYINKYPDLAALMTGTTPYTLFAPSNEAFVNLLATPGFPSNINSINPDIIKGVLSYHFVATQKLSAELTAGSELSTLYTDAKTTTVQKIVVNADLTLKTGSTNQAIKINAADKKATNGVVHVVQSVMIPPSVGATLTPILGTMAGTILLGKDFTQLAKIITAADGIFTETATAKKITTYLAMPSANYPGGKGGTFFASPNAVLTDATVTALTSAADKGRLLLLNHLVAGKYGVAAGTDITVMATTGQTIIPFSTKTITVIKATAGATNPFGVIVTTGAATDQTKYAPIFSKDIAHSNGIIQVIGGLLQ